MFESSKSQRGKGTQQSNDDWIVALIWCIFKAVGYLLWLAILFPALSIPAVVSLGMTLCYGIVAGMLTAVTLVAGYGTWAALDARSFEAWIAQPVRQRFLMWWRYTRNWESVCALNGLTTRDRERDRTLTPRLRSVCIGKHTDAIDLRVVTGQSVNDWQKRVHELAAAWRADRLTIRATAPGELRITITRYDLLAQSIPLPPRAASTNVNLAAVCGRDHRYPPMVAGPCARPSPARRGRHRSRQRVSAVVAYRRPCTGRQDRASTTLRHRPERGYGARRRGAPIHRVFSRRRRRHP